MLEERCPCNTTGAKRLEVTVELRSKIYKEVWCMSWTQREVFVKSLVHKCSVVKLCVEQSASSRHKTLNLNIGSGLVPV